jgi:capsular exopolysaccharide synthesis family protein
VDLRDYARTLRKRWALVALCTLLTLGAAAAATLLATKQYTSSTQLFVSSRDQTGAISDALQGSQFAQQRIKSYAQVADSPGVTDIVAEKLGISPAQLVGKVVADAPLDTVLLNITATDKSPAQAQKIAAAVADEVTTKIPELETPSGSNSAPVKITVIKSASLPGAPSSPRPKVNLALGLLVGLALGVGAAVLRETLDTTVKGKDDLQKLTGATPLGVIAHDPDVAKRPLVVQVEAQSPRAETFRQLRTNLQFVDVDRPVKTVVVTSASAGEGKSTTACNLAITLAQAGVRTILVEADLRRPRVADYMGLEGAVGLTSVLTGVTTLEEALQPWGRNAMWVMASGPLPPNPSEILGSHQMSELLKTLEDRADVIVFDSPPLLPVTDAAVLARHADGAVLVVRHGKTRREQVTRALEALQGVDAKVLGTVLNWAPIKGPDADNYGYGPGYYSTRPGRGKATGTGAIVSSSGTSTTTVVPRAASRRRKGRSRTAG